MKTECIEQCPACSKCLINIPFYKFDYFDFPRIHETVTAEDVISFLAEVIRPDNCALSIIYPIHQEETV